MCETSHRYHLQRRRLNSLSLTIFQWSYGNRSPDSGGGDGIGIRGGGREMMNSHPPYVVSASEVSPVRTESPLFADEFGGNENSDSDLDESVEYKSRTQNKNKRIIHDRSISESSLDSASRSIATQTPTEDVRFDFPDPVQIPQLDEENDVDFPEFTKAEYNRVFDGSSMLRSVPSSRRRHSLIEQSLSSINVPRTTAIDIPGGGRHLSYSVSFSSGVMDTSSIGQELRNIGDDFDRIGGRTSRSLTYLASSS